MKPGEEVGGQGFEPIAGQIQARQRAKPGEEVGGQGF